MPTRARPRTGLTRPQSKCLACAQSAANGVSAFGWRRTRIGALFSKATHAAQDVLAARVTELLRDHLARTASRQGPVWPPAGPPEVLERWPGPDSGPPETLDHLLADVLAGSTHQHHPGFVGQQLSAPPPFVAPVAMVAAILNNSAAIFEGAPVAIALERQVVTWMTRQVGYG